MLKLLGWLIVITLCAYGLNLIFTAIEWIFNLLFRYWWVLGLCMFLAVVIYSYRWNGKRQSKEKQKRQTGLTGSRCAEQPVKPETHRSEAPIEPAVLLEEGQKGQTDLTESRCAEQPTDPPKPEAPKPQPSPKLPVVRLDPAPTAQPIKRRRPKPPVPEEYPTPEPPPGPHDWLRSHETLDHYIVLDIETTGFSRENDRIIELAAIHYVYGVESERFCTYIDPGREIPRHITALTGIRQADVANAPLIYSIKPDFLRFIQDYPLVGHNIKDFDLPFLSAQLGVTIPNITIDTLELAREIFPEMPTHKLADLNGWLHLHDGSSHRAAEDVETTNELLWACLYPEKYQDIYQAGIQNGFSKPERSAKQVNKQWKKSISTSQIHTNPNASPDSPLYGKRIVFTGELSISREQAMHLAAEQGALIRTSVSGKTDFLVVGQQDMSVVGSDGMSTKEEKAHSLNDLGKGHIQIIDETKFREMVGTSN